MAMPEDYISHEYLVCLFDYDRETGVFTRKSMKGGRHAGSVAGYRDTHGHLILSINNLGYMAHRVAWFYVHKVWPVGQIDHKNMVRTDNRIENLREATRTEQRANQRVRSDSTVGLKGARRAYGGRWTSRITKNGVTYNLGGFSTAEEAHRAYVAKATELFGEFARAA
jgi:hypothetical protein